MRVLACTTLPLSTSSAGLNRLSRMRRALRMQGIELILLGRDQKLGEDWLLREGSDGPEVVFDASRTGQKRYCRAMTFGAQGAAFYRKHLPDIIRHLNCQGVLNYNYQAQTGKEVLRAARDTGVFVVADMVERFGISAYRLFSGMTYQQWRFCRSVLPRMDGVVGISKGWCDWAEKRGLANVWIPSFAEDHGCVREQPSPPDRPFTLTFIGHWIDRELPCTFLGGMRKCVQQGTDVRMRVLGNVGETPRERKPMRMLKSDKVLRDRVDFLGFVDDEQRDRELADADAFILLRPDNKETEMLFPTRLPEYLLTGNPVILSEVGSFRHCFQHRKDVWFVPARCREADVAEAIVHLANMPDERLAIGRMGREAALTRFSLEVLGRRLAGFLHDTAERARTGCPVDRSADDPQEDGAARPDPNSSAR